MYLKKSYVLILQSATASGNIFSKQIRVIAFLRFEFENMNIF
jgi:hypothetical protein